MLASGATLACCAPPPPNPIAMNDPILRPLCSALLDARPLALRGQLTLVRRQVALRVRVLTPVMCVNALIVVVVVAVVTFATSCVVCAAARFVPQRLACAQSISQHPSGRFRSALWLTF